MKAIEDDWIPVNSDWDIDDVCGLVVDMTVRDRAGNLSMVTNSLVERENDWFLFHCGGETKRMPVNLANSGGYDIHVREVK